MAKDEYSLFRKKYIALRDLYGLDNKLVTQFCNLLYNDRFGKGELTYWANGHRKPNVDGIFTLAAFFAVSPFWLGIKDNRDDASDFRVCSLLQVEGIEECLFKDYLDLAKDYVSEEYLDEKFRTDYPKEARANILALLQILIGERKLYPTTKNAVHKERVQAAKNSIITILETKEPVFNLNL